MAKQRINGAGAGRNTAAVERVVAEVTDRWGGDVDAGAALLIERVRGLAAAVDANPTDSQLSIQYGQAIRELRTELLGGASAREMLEAWLWARFKHGCQYVDDHQDAGCVCAGCAADALAALGGSADALDVRPPFEWHASPGAAGRSPNA